MRPELEVAPGLIWNTANDRRWEERGEPDDDGALKDWLAWDLKRALLAGEEWVHIRDVDFINNPTLQPIVDQALRALGGHGNTGGIAFLISDQASGLRERHLKLEGRRASRRIWEDVQLRDRIASYCGELDRHGFAYSRYNFREAGPWFRGWLIDHAKSTSLLSNGRAQEFSEIFAQSGAAENPLLSTLLDAFRTAGVRNNPYYRQVELAYMLNPRVVSGAPWVHQADIVAAGNEVPDLRVDTASAAQLGLPYLRYSDSWIRQVPFSEVAKLRQTKEFRDMQDARRLVSLDGTPSESSEAWVNYVIAVDNWVGILPKAPEVEFHGDVTSLAKARSLSQVAVTDAERAMDKRGSLESAAEHAPRVCSFVLQLLGNYISTEEPPLLNTVEKAASSGVTRLATMWGVKNDSERLTRALRAKMRTDELTSITLSLSDAPPGTSER